MKINKKPLVSVTAAVLAAALLASACGTPSAQNQPSQAPTSAPSSTQAAAGATTAPEPVAVSKYNELGEFPLVNEKEDITVIAAAGAPEFNFDTNLMTSFYEDKTNVHVNWNMIPLEQFKEKVNLAFAGGDKIDLVIAGGNTQTAYSMTEVLKLAEQGVILPIEDLIENETIYFKQRLGEYEGWRELITLPNGGIYQLPTINECYHCMYYGKMWINQTFLKNVGLTNPTTIEEFRDMLIAFRDKDANGNGDPNDEIPMIGAIDNYGAKIDTYLMSAFVFDDGENRLYLDNGKVTAAFVQPEFKEGLTYINGLFNEDLIYKESFTQTRDTRNKLNSQKYESLAGAMPNIHHGIGNRETGQPVRWIEYEPIAPLKGPNGLQITRYNYYEKFQTNMTAGFIPETCKDPVLVMRWLDWFMSDEGTTTLLRGQKGITWDDPDSGSTGVDGRPAAYKTIQLKAEDKYYGNAYWGQAFPNFNTAESRFGQQQPNDMLAEDGTGLEKFLYTKSHDNYAPYAIKVEDIIPPLFYSSADVSEIAQLTTNINTYVEESIAKFIIGDLKLDSDWDKFINELNNLGLNRYLEIIQKTYDSSAFAK